MLIPEDPKVMERGFSPYTSGGKTVYVLSVPVSAVENAYQITVLGRYRGVTVGVWEAREGHYTVYTSSASEAAAAGIARIEPGWYQMEVPQDEVSDIVEELEPIKGLPFKG